MTKLETKGHKIELLAPVGSFTTLQAALNAGCDSVYFGIADFNMRASAVANFKIDDLPEVIKRCHDKGVTCFVTVNTVLYDEELTKMRNVIDAVKSAGADAVIVADMAALIYAREQGVEAHISTQMAVSNLETVKFYAQYSDRIVLARELSLSQIKAICDEIENQKIKGPSGKLVEIEVFVHGALCVAVSGRCAMSLYEYGTSASKGKCAQVCRRKFKVTDIDTGQELVVDNNYIMSAADLNTITMLDKIVAAGVTALKIEGRGRGPEYVDTVVSCYREALDSIKAGDFSGEKVNVWQSKLSTVYNRGFSKGLFMGRTFDEWSGVAGSKATLEKTYVGNVKNYYKEIGVVVVEILGGEVLNEGDMFAITGPTTGIVSGTLKSMKIESDFVKSIKKGDIVSFELASRVRKGDEFYLVKEKAF
jgi:putative protease